MFKIALAVTNTSTPCSDIAPPINLAMLSAYVKAHVKNVQVRIFDGMIPGVDVFKEICEYKPDLVGVTATTPQIVSAYTLLDNVRALMPTVKTVVGGVHASALQQEAAMHADVVVVGEGEEAFKNIVEATMNGLPIQSIIFGKQIENLDDLPMPDYNELRMEYYGIQEHNKNLLPSTARLVTSRGCPYRCPFCYNSTRRGKVTYQSAAKIVAEIKYLMQNYSVKSIIFHDDEFIHNKKRLFEFFKLLEQEDLKGKFQWVCQARVDSITDEVVEAMIDNGCVSIFLGIENATPKTLEYLKCGTVTVKDVEHALDICYKHKIDTYGSMIFGSPGETINDMKNTFNWMRKHRNKYVTFGIAVLTPYPGSKVWDEWYPNQNSIDYNRLDFNLSLSERYIVNQAVDPCYFRKFVNLSSRFIWIWSNRRKGTNMKSLMRYKTFWWLLLVHPRDFYNVMAK
jgi:anaerobic magnesium-protoporphyrin IX monomethyl ester cyclase